MTSEIKIAVLARAPVAGEAKTRLIPLLGAQGAADAHRTLMKTTLQTVRSAGFSDVTLWCAPDCTYPYFSACEMLYGVRLAPQPSGDLGARMLAAFAHAQARLLLLGTDCPSITVAHLKACAQALRDGADCVFLPTEDGGYGLIGAQRAFSGLFKNIEWGSARVMAQTREAIAELGFISAEPAIIWDVDTPADYVRWQESLDSA